MSNLRGSIATADGRRAWGLVGAVVVDGEGLSIRLCVVAPTRMEAISIARASGVTGLRVEVDQPPSAQAVLAALDTIEGVVWRDWFGTLEWQGLGSMSR